jgi:hypothetical protein
MVDRPTCLSLALLLVVAAVFLDGCWITYERDRFEGENPGDCSDDADNDADGFFDCDDQGCANSEAGSPDDDDDDDDDDSADDDDDDSADDDDDSADDDDDSSP